MNSPQSLRFRPFGIFALATLFVVSAAAQAQTTKTAPIAPKAQEKAKAKAAEKAKSADKIDLNSASEDDLMELPGVGEHYAKRIIEGRPYKSVDDLEGAGIPAATVAKLKPNAIVKPLPAPVDVNTASVDKLEGLPGVGPALAKAIVDGRPYANFEDLEKVKGLGQAKLDALRGHVSFGKPATTTEKAKAKVEAAKSEAKTKGDAAKDDTKPKADAAKTKVATAKEDMKSKAKGKTTKATLPPGKKVNINSATEDELDLLYGIGPARAKLIIAGRPYEKIEDIMKVKGIKEFEFDKIKDQITVK